MTNLTPGVQPSIADSTALLAEEAAELGDEPRAGWRLMLPTLTPWLSIGLVLVVGILLYAFIAPFLVSDPDVIRDIGLTKPSSAHLLGTTQTGQDIFSQLAFATRGSLEIGFLVGILATALSAFFGIYGAYRGGLADEAFSVLSNVFLVIPGLPLVIVISGFVPRESRGLWTIAVVLALTGWAASARVLRAQTLSVRNRDYVAASRISGEKPWRVIGVEILPNLLPVLASQFVFSVIAAILAEAGLSYLGLGASGSSTLGTMLFYAQNGFALPLGAWWWFVPPGLMIALFGMGLSLINFSIDEIINPKLKNVRLHRRRARQVAKLERVQQRQHATMSKPPTGDVEPAAPVAAADPAARPVLTVRDLTVVYEVDEPVTAVKGAAFTLSRGEILGLAGESGCGKTTLAYAINRLHRPPARIVSGDIVFHDRNGEDLDILGLDDEQLRVFRWDKLSMVFQGAMNALNPVISIEAQLRDTLRTHRPDMSRADIRARSVLALERVEVDPGRLGAFPHELSGGMRQRVMIAMAMLLEPQIMIMDEPTTALDVVVQRDILREIVRLRDKLDFAVIFITHDLPLLLEISDRIAIMLRGEIVELDTALRLYREAKHPYTRKLLGSFPSLSGQRGGFIRTGAHPDASVGSIGEPV